MTVLKRIVLITFLLFLLSSLTKNLLDYKKKYQFYLDYKNAYDKERKQNISLKTELLKKKDPNEIEKTIRNKLNLSKPDEVVVLLPQPTPTPVVITPTPAPNWQQWWNVYFPIDK